MCAFFAEANVGLPPKRGGELLIDDPDLAVVVYRERRVSNVGYREKVFGRPGLPSIFGRTHVESVDAGL